MTIPQNIAAKVLFMSDRTCCVCRVKSKLIQIHHIDEDNSNNDIDNLSVLCIDCHNETQIKGGFHRKLNAEQVILYRDDWHSIISRDRLNIQLEKDTNFSTKKNIEYYTTLIENFREQEQFYLMSKLYHSIGNYELRDKYIEKALKKDASNDTLISLRSIQGRIEEVPKDIIEEEIKAYEKHQNWSQLARFYIEVGNPKKAIYYYCKCIMDSIEQNVPFSAGYYLKEMQDKKLEKSLFELALKKAIDEDELWWQYRAMQELEWKSEIKDFVLRNKKQIEKEYPGLMIELLTAMGEEKKAHDLFIKQASSTKIARVVAGKE